MKVLIKPNQFSTSMYWQEVRPEQVTALIERPAVCPEKSQAPLAIWGTMAQTVELDKQGMPRCTGNNLESIYCLQLDYDNGEMSIDRFQALYGAFRWTLYTSYSYGYKNVGTDRYRVILPLAKTLPTYLLHCPSVKQDLLGKWPECDPTCFDCGHWQLLPVVRSKDSPYRWLRSAGTARFDFDLDRYTALHSEWLEEARKRRESAKSEEGKDHSGAVRYVQTILETTQEGYRNRTLYTKLNWLHDIGAGVDEVERLQVWPDMQKEFQGMVARIWG